MGIFYIIIVGSMNLVAGNSDHLRKILFGEEIMAHRKVALSSSSRHQIGIMSEIFGVQMIREDR